MKKNKVIFTGGGTGGHVFPLVSVIRNLKKEFSENEDLELFYIAPKDSIPDFSFSEEGLETRYIFAGKLRRYLSPVSIFLNLIDLIKIPIGIIQSIIHIFKISPDLVFSKGGYGSVPVVIAAKIMQIPIILHESDAIPGLANRIVSKFSTEIFVAFQKTKGINPGKKFVIGNPIRKELTRGSAFEAQKRFNLQGEKPIILVIGGSQGSLRINDTILAILPQLLDRYEIIHITGERNYKQVKNESHALLKEDLEKFYHPFPFFAEDELKDAYAAADLIVSRAGAGSIFEILANHKASILIPLAGAAQNHQAENAYRLAERGAAIVMEEENLTPHFFLERIKSLFSLPEELEEIRENTKELAKPEAGRILAAYIKEFLIQ
jgi:UDP-N-acetylglucosamine--N-acetylmuramyl-(pentapeptide) pyrophosphoryl-undecaprenol N-acetylglucosamine transferase